jgi:hypothetical protein
MEAALADMIIKFRRDPTAALSRTIAMLREEIERKKRRK